MAWSLGTWVSGSFPLTPPAPALDVQDYVVKREVWEEKRNTFLGTDLVILTNPTIAARGVLDDEVNVTGFVSPLPGAPVVVFAAGGRRKTEYLLKKAWDFQNKLTYGRELYYIDPGEFWNDDTDVHVLVKNSIEHLPVLLRKQAIQKSFDAALGYGWLDGLKTRPYLVPAGEYADTKCRILMEIQRHFLEPVIDEGHTWQLWSYEEVHKVLEYRLYRFLLETGIIRKEAFRTVSYGGSEAALPQDCIEIRRVDWEFEYAGAPKPRVLQRIDTLQADSGFPGWDETEGIPVGYIKDPMVDNDSMLIRTCPPPEDTGTASIRYVPMPSLNMAISCEPLPIPRMFTWAVKWGVIADLLKKEGEANDLVRSQQAEKIYELGVDMARFLIGARS